MKLEEGRRVYVPSRDMFGNVVRNGGILGLKSSFAVIDDTGKRLVFVDKNPEFVYVDTCEDVCGHKKDIPEDVVTIFRENLTKNDASKMTHDYCKMSREERDKMYNDWKHCLNNPAAPVPVPAEVVEDKRPVTRRQKSLEKKNSTKYY